MGASWLGLVVLVAGFLPQWSGAVPDEGPMYTDSQCFNVRGIPTLELACPRGSLIWTHAAFFGAAANASQCRFDARERHCWQYVDLEEDCNGRYSCSVMVTNPFLMNCRTYANYMQVNYTCLPISRVADVCQSASYESVAGKGYLRTPNFPDANYSSNTHCRCHLTTQDDYIQFWALDFTVHHTSARVCDSDFLRVVGWGKQCGHFGRASLPKLLNVTLMDTVDFQFHTDNTHNAKGFWLEYVSSAGGKVSVTCGLPYEVDPPDDDTGQRLPENRPPSDRPLTTDRLPLPNTIPFAGSDSPVLVNDLGAIFGDYSTSSPAEEEWLPPSNKKPPPSNKPQNPNHELKAGYPAPSPAGNNIGHDRTNYRTDTRLNTGLVDTEFNAEPLPPEYRSPVEPAGPGETEFLPGAGADGVFDGEEPPTEGVKPAGGSRSKKTDADQSDGGDFSTLDFTEHQGLLSGNVDTVQLVTGCVIGVLVLIAIVIIVFLVFRKSTT